MQFLICILLGQILLQAKTPNVIDYSQSELLAAYPELKKVAFAADQSALPALLSNIGERVDTLFRNLPNTSSVEDVRSEALDRKGAVIRAKWQRFLYLLIARKEANAASVIPSGEQIIKIEEVRTNAKGEDVDILKTTQTFLLTKGFASIPVYLHPMFQEETDYRYIGQEPDGTHVIAFAQNPAKARMRGIVVSVSGQEIPFFLHGMAWVNPVSFQIVRMRTDLLPGMDTADLRYATTQITLEEVRFPKVDRSLWLPHEVVVTTNWMGGSDVRNRHRYSDYRLFTVDAKEDEKRSIIRKPE
jgi:hypothetical protein